MAEVKLKLVVVRGGTGLKPEYPLAQKVVTIGRSINNLIVLQDNKVSRYHAEIVRLDGEYVIKDLESANGIKVNNVKALNKPLEPNDHISIGNSEFRVEQVVSTGTETNGVPDFIDASATAEIDNLFGDSSEDDGANIPAFLSGNDLDREDEKLDDTPDFESSAGFVPGRHTSGAGNRTPTFGGGGGGRDTMSGSKPPMIRPREEPPLGRSPTKPPPGLFDRSNARPDFDELTPERVDTSAHKLLEHVDISKAHTGIGGMGQLMDWLGKRAKAVLRSTKGQGLPRPSGIAIIGGPGCGKTLVTLHIANQWGLNFFRLHLPYLLFSPPEKWLDQVSDAFSQAVAYSPSILAVEDIDHMASRVEVMGEEIRRSYFMVMEVINHWVHIKSPSPFTVVTGTSPRLIHPDLLRRGGSLDEVFYIDLPHVIERLQIFEVQLIRMGQRPDRFDLKMLAEGTDGYTGGQITEGITGAMFDALAEGREANTQDMKVAFSRIVPLIHTYGKGLEELRQWGRLVARPASFPPNQVKPQAAPAPAAVPQPAPVAANAARGAPSAPVPLNPQAPRRPGPPGPPPALKK